MPNAQQTPRQQLTFSPPASMPLKPLALLMLSLFATHANAQTLAEQDAEQTDIAQQSTAKAASQLPSATERYNIKKETLLAADSSDSKLSDEPNKVNSPNKDKAIVTSPNKTKESTIELQKVQIRAKRFHEIGPLPGLGLTKDEIPGNVQSITAKEIKDSHSLSITDLMNKKLQSVNVNDYQGNPFMMDVTYRGFTAGPQIGTPQGLSVFFDGIRVNEPFGDVVNWDLIPMNALAGVDVFPGSNPIFGLGTLGGAFTVKTKDGFNHEGVDAEILTGSYGRKQLQVTGGTNNGTFALFGAGNFFLEDGWRDNSPSKVNQFFGKASYRGEKLDLHLSTLLVGTDLVGNGLLPSEQYRQDPSSVFTAPDTTKNKLIQFQISSAFQVNDHFNITGQLYNRKSDRKSVGADVYTEYSELDQALKAPRNIDAGDEFTCLYASTNPYKLPDYYVLDLPPVPGTDIPNITTYSTAADPLDPANALYNSNANVKFVADVLSGTVDLTDFSNLSAANQALLNASFNKAFTDPAFVQYAQTNFIINQNDRTNRFFNKTVQINPPPLPDGNSQFQYAPSLSVSGSFGDPNDSNIFDVFSGLNNYYYTPNGDGTYTYHAILVKKALNADKCASAIAKYGNTPNEFGVLEDKDPATDIPRLVNGAYANGNGLDQSTTVVQGVPTAVITENEINQMVKGGALQLNWNLDHHKFMVGASIDSGYAEYKNTQQLGFIDAQRNVYLDPAQALDAYALANGEKIPNNNFDGTSITKSIYASETWSPIETVHINGSVRYNDTKVKNSIAERSKFTEWATDLHKFTASPNIFGICPAGNISADGKSCVGVATGYQIPSFAKLLNPAETEKFSYYSLNPSIGATWQATPNLNIFGNVAKGTRTPSVIELGCAIDKTSVKVQDASDSDGDGILDTPARYTYKSLFENRSCSLPSALSGDPYLPQIKATTFDIGLRGTLASALGMDNIEWNLGAYRTDLKDDIYLVTFGVGKDFFDTIGKTRRQGIEAGFGGNYGKARFKINYAYTDATFEDTFTLASADNSSAELVQEYFDIGKQITVKPGDRMPGVPLHNLNATLSYDVTPKWNVGLTAVAHSESFVRGNENNNHKKITTPDIYSDGSKVVPAGTPNAKVIYRQRTFSNPGKVPGYATFNFQTSYKFNNEWTASMLVNNLFDKEYFSAGRLGINPFSPQIGNTPADPNGSGYNHNSAEWQSTNFIAPSAPRGIWFSLNWQFDPKK